MSDDLTDRALADVERLHHSTELERTLARLLAEARDEITRLKEAIKEHREEVKCCEECAANISEAMECPDGKLWALLDG